MLSRFHVWVLCFCGAVFAVVFWAQVQQRTVPQSAEAVETPYSFGEFAGASVVRDGVTYTLSFEQYKRLLDGLKATAPTPVAKFTEVSLEGIQAIILHRPHEPDEFFLPLGRRESHLLLKGPNGVVIEETEAPRLFALLMEASRIHA